MDVHTPLLLVLGGAGSGRDDYADERLQRLLGGGGVLCVTAAHERDARAGRRDPRWRTVRAGTGGDVASALTGERGMAVYLEDFAAVLRAARPLDDERAEAYAVEVAAALRRAAGMLAVVVSTEAGLGADPAETLGAELRDRLGAANRALAATAEEVVLVVAGLPVQLKEPGA